MEKQYLELGNWQNENKLVKRFVKDFRKQFRKIDQKLICFLDLGFLSMAKIEEHSSILREILLVKFSLKSFPFLLFSSLYTLVLLSKSPFIPLFNWTKGHLKQLEYFIDMTINVNGSISVLWQIKIHMAKKWPEMVVKWFFTIK